MWRRKRGRPVPRRDAHSHGGDPEATATPTATPAALDPLDWRSAQHTGQPVRLVRARSGFLGIETRAVASLTSSGSFRRRSTGPRGRQLLRVAGVPQSFVPGPRPGLMTRIDSGKRHAARYGFVTLPAG